MSSVVTAPDGASSRSRPATRLAGLRPGSLTVDFLAGAAVALALVLISFLATGGTNLTPNTWIQVALVVIAAAAGIAVVMRGAAGRAWGAGTLLLFTALAALTYASIAWSVQPASSWLEGNRTLSYLAVFGIALAAARIAPGRWSSLLGGIATATTVVCGYALLAKVFPATFDPLDTLGRLSLPLGYWNAIGLIAALGIPACLWAGSRRDHAPWLRALSVPAIAILVAALVLSYSRGALAAAVIGSGLWFVFAPVRLRAALVVILGGAGGAAIAAWALATHAISSDNVALPARTSAGHAFGIALLVVLVLTTLAGLVAAFGSDRIELSPRLRRRTGTVLLCLVALVPVAGVGALAASSRGLTGEVSHIWSTLTNPNGSAGDKPGRLVDLSNSRPHYWSEALTIGKHHLLAGAGADGFATAQLQYPSKGWDVYHSHVEHAHGYLLQTFADFGLVGVLLSLALLVSFGITAGRSLGVRWSRTARMPPPLDAARVAERTGLLTLLAITITFGFSSLIDWTWFVPATAIMGLACAGWLAGRGPLASPIGQLKRSRQPSRTPSAAIGIASIVVIALAAVWVTVQPLRSTNADSAALAAAIRGNAGGALTNARAAAADDPVSIDPLNLLSTIYVQLGDQGAARRALIDATSRQSSNPAVWEQLGCYDFGRRDYGHAAGEFDRALALDPSQTKIHTDPVAFCTALSAGHAPGGFGG